jgi:O-antigen/teichoic acid export membrane protein
MIGKKLVSQSLIYGIASLLINGSNIFLIPLYANYLTTTEYGIISSVTLFSTIGTSFLTLGLNSAITRFYVEFDKVEFKRFLFSVFFFQLSIAFLIACTFIFFGGFFLDHLFANVPYDPFLKYGIYIGLTGIFSTIPLALLQAQSKALLYRILTTTSFIIATTLMISFIVFRKEGSLGGIKASLYANLLMAPVYVWFILRNGEISFRVSYLKTALLFSLPIMVYAVFGTLTELSSRYFIERFISLSELGIYNIAQQIASLLVLLINAVNMAWVPIFYEEAKKNENSTLFSDFGKLLVFTTTLVGLTLSLFSKELIALLMPESYSSVSIYIPYLVLAYIFGSGYWVLVISPISFSRKTIYLPVLTILSGVLSISLSLLLVPNVGAIGAALSTLISYCVLISVTYFIYKKHSAIKYDFRKMNTMVMLGAFLYILSTQIPLLGITTVLAIKVLFVGIFIFSLHYRRIYSFLEVRNFIKNKFN